MEFFAARQAHLAIGGGGRCIRRELEESYIFGFQMKLFDDTSVAPPDAFVGKAQKFASHEFAPDHGGKGSFGEQG